MARRESRDRLGHTRVGVPCLHGVGAGVRVVADHAGTAEVGPRAQAARLEAGIAHQVARPDTAEVIHGTDVGSAADVVVVEIPGGGTRDGHTGTNRRRAAREGVGAGRRTQAVAAAVGA